MSSLIEGIGDDFLYALGLIVFLALISLAWLSTRVNQIQFPATLVIIERRATSELVLPVRRQESGTDEQIMVASVPSQDLQAEHESDIESSEAEEMNSEQTSIPTQFNSIQTQDVHTVDQTQLRIVIKFLNDTQKAISAHPNDTISKVKQLYFAHELANNQMVRFIYQGRELQDGETLRTCNIRDQTIIHCQINTRRHAAPPNRGTDTFASATHVNGNAFDPSSLIDASPVNISSHFLLLLTAVLGLIWYLRVKYRLLFSPISTIILILITIIFLIFTCGSRLTTARRSRHTTTIAITPIQHVHLD